MGPPRAKTGPFHNFVVKCVVTPFSASLRPDNARSSAPGNGNGPGGERQGAGMGQGWNRWQHALAGQGGLALPDPDG